MSEVTVKVIVQDEDDTVEVKVVRAAIGPDDVIAAANAAAQRAIAVADEAERQEQAQ